ncbi:hypothetical protein OV207_20735 [Corallococcus sp. BB11-1]|uniref:hypothetical protein n=1 Tax=Corallococcus sp. BB11-1 TaxID=2996783 RepID=UPI00226E5381|nr:hypothetical protein [Corallococcus sp. BB11-1]MCY1033892.1 hypothetical protein [Corallococcus sp. BB11-1]
MRVFIDPDANDDTPVALSLVLVYEPNLTQRLRGLTADQWFDTREQILRDGHGKLDEIVWEFIPGQELPEYTRPLRPQPATGLLFVRYVRGGLEPYPFIPERPLRIALRKLDARVEQDP